MSQLIPTTLAAILTAAEDKIISDGLYGPNACFISLNPDAQPTTPAGDQYVVITPGRQSIKRQIFRGGQTIDLFTMSGEMQLTLWSRLVLDQIPRDDSYLTDPTFGALAANNCLIASLNFYLPLDADGNRLILAPLLLKSIDHYGRDFDGVGWGSIRTLWAYEYSQSFVACGS